MGLAQQVGMLFNQGIYGSGVRVTKYPVDAIGVTCTSGATTYLFDGAGANTKIIIAAGVLTPGTPFRLAWIGADTPSAVNVWIIRVGISTAAGAAYETTLYEAFVDMLVAGRGVQISVPFAATILASTTGPVRAVVAEVASTTGSKTLAVSLGIMTGMGS